MQKPNILAFGFVFFFRKISKSIDKKIFKKYLFAYIFINKNLKFFNKNLKISRIIIVFYCYL